MENLLHLRSTCTWPSIYYEELDSLVPDTDSLRILEVGVAYGLHAEHLLTRFEKAIYFGIDPYVSEYDESDSFAMDVHMQYQHETSQLSMDSLYADVKYSLENRFRYRSFLIRSSLKPIEKLLPAESFDFIFIDGDHRPNAVESDIRCSLKLIKQDGIIAGDDYLWPGTKEVVLKICNEQNLIVNVLHCKNGHKIWYTSGFAGSTDNRGSKARCEHVVF
jgi:hypothetical protein